MANTIQVRRGAVASLPTLNAGEFGFSTDTKQIYIGDGAANHELARAKLASALELNEKTILIDAALSTDHTWTGPTQAITAGENLAQFEVAYLKSDGKYWRTDADAVATSKSKIVMATAAISASGTGTALLPSPLSFIRDDSTTKWTVTAAGDEMFLSTTIGELTNNISGYSTADIVRIAGYMETAVILNFDVSKTYLEIS